jgi:hypothetical protein
MPARPPEEAPARRSAGVLHEGEVLVVGVFGDETAEADLAEVVDDASQLFDVLVEGVGVLVEDGEQQLLATLPVAPLSRRAGDSGDLLHGLFRRGRVGDPELAEPLVHRLELSRPAEKPCIQLVDLGTGRLQAAVVAGRGEEEVEDGEVEHHGEDQQLVGVELATPLPVPGTFHRGDARLGEALSEVGLEPVGQLFLCPASQLAGLAQVVGDDLVEVDLVVS